MMSSDLREFDAPNFKNSTFRLDRPSSYLLNKARRDEINGYSNLKKSMSSSTVYIGKLSFDTTEEQLFELFSNCGTIVRIIMGLDKHKLTPTGFCFIIFDTPSGALNSIKYLNKTKVNGRSMEIDLDPGFEEGRQFGRGADGGQRQPQQQYGHRYEHGRRDAFDRTGRSGYRNTRGRARGRNTYRERQRHHTVPQNRENYLPPQHQESQGYSEGQSKVPPHLMDEDFAPNVSNQELPPHLR
ncbi:hypothetical protein KL938_000541 [Ogataea parapolymorpha]|nr:hypothetical protein KL938_000541 [Ogataea parapolymorpha]